MPGSKAKIMPVEFCLDPARSSDFFWINFILVSAPYIVTKIAIINSRSSSSLHRVAQEKKKVHLSKFPCESSKDGTSWCRLTHTPIPDLITVATGMK